MHHRLLAKAADDWSLGSPAPAHYAAILEIVSYVMRLGAVPGATASTRRDLFARGMGRIAAHERALLRLALEGTDKEPGLRSIPGVTVRMDGSPLEMRDFIIGIEFGNIGCEEAVAEYEKRGVIVFERSAKSLYSRRMVEAFGSQGVVRVSPLHVHGPGDIARFLRATREIAKTAPSRYQENLGGYLDFCK
jgi:selenocysteine lyase/cysteine desulfurase